MHSEFLYDCPNCKSIDTTGRFIVRRDGIDIYEYQCHECGETWEEWEGDVNT